MPKSKRVCQQRGKAMQRLISLLLLGLIIGCGQSETKTQEATKPAEQAAPAPAATAPAQPPTTEPAPTGGVEQTTTEAMPSQPPAGESSFRGDPAKGAATYAQICSTCHGPTGGGDGPAAAGLNPKPAPHNDPEYMAKISDEEMYNAIKNGGAAVGKSPLMPAWGATLTDQQIRDVLAFTRTLAEPKK